MSPKTKEASSWNSSALLSVCIFVLAIGSMAWLRLYFFQERFVALTYGLPLLACLWHRDKKLLWSMSAAFIVMSGYKVIALLPDPNPSDSYEPIQWLMQVANILIIAGTVHAILNLTARLTAKNVELNRANDELTARAEEISRQNEELESQGEELAQQNEEIQAQAEELSQQNEELQGQSEELQSLNSELNQREAILESLLQSVNVNGGDPSLQRICELMVELFGRPISAASVLERKGDSLILVSQVGLCEPPDRSLPFNQSFTEIVMEHDKTAGLEDLDTRRDLKVPHCHGGQVNSVLSTPLRLDGKPVGTVEVYSTGQQQWTTKDFRLIEWVAAQCSLNLEARRLREALSKANESLETTVCERTEKLQEMVNELEHFSYTITHDMRAPLRAMQGFAGLLAEECAEMRDEVCKEYLDLISRSAARMDDLITDALSFSRSVQQELELSPVDTTKLLKGIIECYPEFQEPNAKIQIRGTLPPVFANEAGLAQCFSNLLGNAVKFVAAGQQVHVTIRAERRGENVRLWFEDNGIGITPEMLPRIFGMFQRASKDFEGTGIGLALVRKVTERMNGSVGVESEIGKGSRFWLELKLAC